MKNITEYLVDQFVSTGLDHIGFKYIYLDGNKTDYVIDTESNVYSINYNHTKKVKKLKTNITKGYVYIMLPYKNKRKNIRLNRLVALAFLPIPEKYISLGMTAKDLEVNHIDGNPLNNDVTNLEWLTPAENKSHASKHKLLSYGEDNPKSKLTENQVIEICEILEKGKMSRYKIAKLYKVDHSTITSIYKKETWKAITANYDFSNYNPVREVKIGEKNNLSKLTEPTVRKICELIVENKLSQKQIAKKMHVSIGAVSNIQYRHSWKHISKDYDFSNYNVDGRKTNGKHNKNNK